ncbi:hypothetical protein [Parafilimonas sp.]|uniref:hypothetical protein n=1 Tax=Parafilimonas sp. TaxID=1969739 RepID=UPI0039E4F280
MNFPEKLRWLIMLCLFATAAGAQSQSITINSVQNSLETLAANFPQEKIYIQFDKPSYAPGDTIWFKSYIMTGTNPSQISKTVYIDFVNTDGRVLKHCISPVLQAGGSGDYGIPLDFKEEVVYVKAYTKWMLNFDSSFLYRKTLQVIQPKPTGTRPVPAIKTNLQFLPEGGNIVENIETNIAFKALHFDGTPAPVSGAVFNNSNTKVADIKTVHDGMGSFLLTAKNGETYTARWKDDLGNDYETGLPAAQAAGVVLKVLPQADARPFTIQRSENAPPGLQKLYILATMQQHLVYGASVNLKEVAVTGGSIPVKELPSGVLQVTLFDSNWVAVAERISFINNEDYAFEPEVGFAQLSTEKRKQNTLVIHTDSISANLSVAVTDAGIGIDSSDDIVSRLLLTGDLKGRVYHPYYYFQNNSDTLQQQLDLVMLTNGWRRISWDAAIHNKYPAIKYQNEPDYLSLSGKLYGATDQELKQGAMLLMIIKNSKDTSNRIEQAIVDGSGKFANPNIILYDTSKIYYKISGNDRFANSSVISFDNSTPSPKTIAEDTAANAFLADTATENFRRRLAEEELRAAKFRQGNTLKDVVVKTRTKSPLQMLDEKYASPLFSGDGYQFDVMNDPFGKSAISVFQYLQGKVAGLQINTAGGTPSVTWRGGTPAFFLDEVQQSDPGMLSSLSMSDVAYIKVLRPPFVGAMGGGANGAIAVYTRKGGDVASTPGKGLPYKVIIGYTGQKEFYSPNYDIYNNNTNDRDLRTTLFWSPNILTTPANNTFRLKFYNNDITQRFRVIVEGITTDGKLAHIEKIIE